MQAEVRSVDRRNRTKPDQFSRPRIPAAAPAKQEEMNLTFIKEVLAMTLGGYINCAVASAVVDMVVQR